MSKNIGRYSFTNFTNKPYISNYGIPCPKLSYQPEQNYNKNRTIIRTNQSNRKILQYVPVNGMDNIQNDQKMVIINKNNNIGNSKYICDGTYDNNWSNRVRKDNMFINYASNHY